MSSEALPISPARFAEATKELSLATLHLKVLEIRNDVAHLDYSNEQLLPYAQGAVAVLGAATAGSSGEPVPDQDCIDAIKENLAVVERKLNQLKLVREEVERRGVSWTEFQSKEEAEQQQAEAEQRTARTSAALAAARQPAQAATNGSATATTASTAGNPWTDGTFQTGTVRNGELHMDAVAGQSLGASADGGSLTDEQLRRALDERLGLSGASGQDGEDDEDGGLHL
ncbi:hypothetical protein SCUCBS95973_008623 [Sporothrix curviconia]|uniref:Secondary alcohol dehydrogenase n=1 Tax=Sporothrix curviconia TaxID=1260050 RepID=A0ABP0CN17_9PEZI